MEVNPELNQIRDQAQRAAAELCDAGIDIGGTLIGMHIHPVVVPVRISMDRIGEASIICARRRPKYVCGQRAIYDEALL